ncbi:MAG TPA: prolipoprotein diacylglyceryl transferase family protein [Anaerolineales bacterium]|nr:prolipoprotein diacylglyceryl transferase family protein [Anaerolineales bacterium]
MITFFRSIFAPPRHLILIVVALWIGLLLAERRSERHGISKDALNNLVFYGLFGYLIGGRLFYALANFSIFAQSPLSLFSPNLDLFDPMAGIAVAFIVGLVYGSRQKLPLWPTLDAMAPLFATLAVGLSLSHLAAGSAFGSPTQVPWGIELWNEIRHPAQLYELLAALIILGILWFRKPDAPAGRTFLTFSALTATSRLFLEAFRGDSTLVFGGARLAQILAWAALAGTFFAIEWIRVREPAK